MALVILALLHAVPVLIAALASLLTRPRVAGDYREMNAAAPRPTRQGKPEPNILHRRAGFGHVQAQAQPPTGVSSTSRQPRRSKLAQTPAAPRASNPNIGL